MQINLNVEMPRTTLSAVQAELLDFMETLFVAADLLNDNIDDFDDLAELMPGKELDNFKFEDGEDTCRKGIQPQGGLTPCGCAITGVTSVTGSHI